MKLFFFATNTLKLSKAYARIHLPVQSTALPIPTTNHTKFYFCPVRSASYDKSCNTNFQINHSITPPWHNSQTTPISHEAQKMDPSKENIMKNNSKHKQKINKMKIKKQERGTGKKNHLWCGEREKTFVIVENINWKSWPRESEWK